MDISGSYMLQYQCEQPSPQPGTAKEAPKMPRPKGSKNRTPQTIDERITALEEELKALRETITAKEAELAQLKETRDQELVKALMDAIAESGKSVQNVIDMVKGNDLPDELKNDE